MVKHEKNILSKYLRDVCMQFESNPANGFRDMVRERNTAPRPHSARSHSARPHARHGDENI